MPLLAGMLFYGRWKQEWLRKTARAAQAENLT
jgi:hypothetical protein